MSNDPNMSIQTEATIFMQSEAHKRVNKYNKESQTMADVIY